MLKDWWQPWLPGQQHKKHSAHSIPGRPNPLPEKEALGESCCEHLLPTPPPDWYRLPQSLTTAQVAKWAEMAGNL